MSTFSEFAAFSLLIHYGHSVSPYIPGFHFTPTPESWMNDPSAPFYDSVTGLYHLMFDYHQTPTLWGHAVSKDLFTWINLPIALKNDEPYNIGGIFTGSMTVVPKQNVDAIQGNSDLYITYSVQENNAICIATPTNRSDPNLIEWTNSPLNPVVNASETIQKRFRDPSSAWTTDNGKTWYFIYAGIVDSTGNGGAVQIVKTNDWHTFSIQDGNNLFSTNSGGAWSCPDFFQFPNKTLDINVNVTHLLMALIGIYDHWAVGTYDEENIGFIPFNGSSITDNTHVFDHGVCVAGKSFYDSKNHRQVRFAWVYEERPVDKNGDGAPWGWAGIQTLPRKVELYENNPEWIVTPVIEEFNDLHIEETHYMKTNISIKNGQVIFLKETLISGNQMDIMLMFDSNNSNNSECGIWVLSDGETKQEYTRIGVDYGKRKYFVDTRQSSLNQNVSHSISFAGILGWNENVNIGSVRLRIIVDHSIIEVYVNDGLSVMTRRAYPTLMQSVQVALFAFGDDCKISKFNAWNVYTTMWL
eukprot:547238_1